MRDVRQAVATFVANHPDASAMEVIAGVDVDAPLSELRSVVADVLDETAPGDDDSQSTDTDSETDGTPDRAPDPTTTDVELDAWASADFATPEAGVWAADQVERDRWMTRAGETGKQPFAPWADRDHPAAEADEDGRWKWGIDDNHTDKATVDEWVAKHPQVDGWAFIQTEADPLAFVDGDDVRCPETDAVHPAFVALLEAFGLTYADISTSGSGVHAVYRGDLPAGVSQAVFDIDDEPWGANEDPPSVEIYANTHVCVATGEHVPGTPTEARSWDADAVERVLDERGLLPDDDDPVDHDTHRDRPDLDGYEPAVTGAGETTSDVRDVLAAVDRLRPRDLPLRTRQVGTEGDWEKWDPSSYRSSSGKDSLHTPDRERWYDQKHDQSFGLLSLFAAEQGIIAKPWDRLAGEDWWKAVEAAREAGADIPTYESSGEGAGVAATSALPLAQLDALSADERRRYAKERGLDWPTTREARDDLFATITEVMRNEDDRVVDAPTALGKSHTVASTDWGQPDLQSVTGDRPVIHLSATRKARDEAIDTAEASSVDHHVLLGRTEACACAAGDHDPQPDEEDPNVVVTVDGRPVSEFFEHLCEGKGVPFSVAHRIAEERNDQGLDELPCYSQERGGYPAVVQWEELREGDADLVLATHNFLHAPGLRMHTNVVVDEEPDFRVDDLGQDRIRRAVTAFLQAIGCDLRTWEELVRVSEDGLSRNEHDPRDFEGRWSDLREQLARQPDREWFVDDPDAHTLAPAIARAVLALEDRAAGRRAATVPYDPPRLDAEAHDDDAWNREWLSIVVDDDHTVRSLWATPDCSLARSVIGLDAHPALPVWQRQLLPHIDTAPVLDTEQRRLWRRYERGLRVVQVGEATRPLSGDNAVDWFGGQQVEALAEHLRDQFGGDFRTGITTAQVEAQFEDALRRGGVRDPETMHYGNTKSRNDFAGEAVGLVNGCMDPGDDYVLDLVAALDLDARPEPRAADCGHCDGDGCHRCNWTGQERERGRGFVGDDADTAAAILAAVRENEVAQAAGRYARDADDPDDHATVFVRTDAAPAGFVDVQVSGVAWTFGEKQQAVLQALRERPGGATLRELADEVGCSKEHARQTLQRLGHTDPDDDRDPWVRRVAAAGDHGADVYHETGVPSAGVVDLDGIANSDVEGASTWQLAIRDPVAVGDASRPGATGRDSAGRTEWDWRAGPAPPD